MDNLRTLANPFAFTGHDVRTAIDEEGNTWFCAKDVFESVDIKWSGRGTSLRNHSEKHISTLKLRGLSGDSEVIFIAEPSVYRVLLRSNKPECIAFYDWVFEEVLPQLRKTGSYGVLPAKDYIAIIKQIADLTERLINNKNAFNRKMLLKPLQNLCNMAGHPMPELKLLSIEMDQIDLFDGDS